MTGKVTERGRDKERAFLHCLPPQMAAMASTSMGQNQNWELHPGHPTTGGKGANAGGKCLGPSFEKPQMR